MMTTIDSLNSALDANPQDQFLRSLLADALGDAGCRMERGYRELVRLGRVPWLYPVDGYPPWQWWLEERNTDELLVNSRLPGLWFEGIIGGVKYGHSFGTGFSKDFPTRRAAEDAAALAFVKMMQEVPV
jgi:hypothetical protein